MKQLAKLALGAAMLGGLAVTAAAPADVGVVVGIGVGGYHHGCYHCGWHGGYGYHGYYGHRYGYGYGPRVVVGGPVVVGVGPYYWGGHHYWHRRFWNGGWRYY